MELYNHYRERKIKEDEGSLYDRNISEQSQSEEDYQSAFESNDEAKASEMVRDAFSKAIPTQR